VTKFLIYEINICTTNITFLFLPINVPAELRQLLGVYTPAYGTHYSKMCITILMYFTVVSFMYWLVYRLPEDGGFRPKHVAINKITVLLCTSDVHMLVL
jgi:hypothetical protein